MGGSFQFNSVLSHRVHNPGPAPAEVIWFRDIRRPKVGV